MKYSFPIICIILAILSGCVGWYCGVDSKPEWFGRSGSLIVLFAVMSEYSIFKTELNNFYTKVKEQSGRWSDDSWEVGTSTLHNILSLLSHSVIILGTLIWGYGDKILEYLVYA